jgi:antitoxin component YwqK of YwqJK toxin-antitoxin module
LQKKLSILLASIFCLILFGCGTIREEASSNSQEKNGVLYIINEEKPFTGIIIDNYENGDIKLKATYKEGKQNGESIGYHENGQISYKATYKDGKMDGEYSFRQKDAPIVYKAIFKDGKLENDSVVPYED